MTSSEMQALETFDPSVTVWQNYLRIIKDEGASLDEEELASLAEVGFIPEPKVGAVTPLGASLALQSRAHELEQQAARLRGAAQLLEEAASQGESTGYLALPDTGSVLEACVEIMRRATAEVVIWDDLAQIFPESRAAVISVARESMRRGVQYKAVYEDSAIHDPQALEQLEDAVAQGVEVRVLPSLPLAMIVRDGTEGVFISRRPGGPVTGHLVSHEGLIEVSERMLGQFWRLATPVSLRKRRSPHRPNAAEPTSETLHLLAMLSRGLTDQAIAREMGVSQRTAARRVADLAELLGAQSRFQLGVQALRQGWMR